MKLNPSVFLLSLLGFVAWTDRLEAQTFSTGRIDYGLDSANVYCSVAHNSSNEIFACWKDGPNTNAGVYKLVKWNGSGWTQLSSFTSTDALSTAVGSQDDISLAIDSAGGFHVAFRIYGPGADATNAPRVIMYGYSATGTTWTFTEVYRTATSSSGYYNTDDPHVKIDANNRPHVVFLYRDAKGSRVFGLRYHYFNGTSWVGDMPFSQTGASNEITRASFALDSNGKAHVAFNPETNGSGTDASLYYGTNASGSWVFSTLAAGGSAAAAAANVCLTVDASDKVHIVRQDYLYALYYHTNASGSFASSRINGSLSGQVSYQGLSINSAGILFLAYNQSSTSTNTGAVGYAYLPSGGSSWTTGNVMTGNANTMRFWSSDITGTGVATILFDHFSGSGSPGTGNPRESHYAMATIASDTTAPTVVSVQRLTPSTQVIASGPVVYRVTYSEAVTSVTTAQFAFEAVSGTVAGTVASVSGSGTTRDVTVNVTSGTGEFRLKVVN